MSSLISEKRGKVLLLTLNRPKAMNSLDPELLKKLSDAWRDFEADPHLWVAVLTGAGDRAFCTGADLKKTMPPKESVAEQIFNTDELNFIPTTSQKKPIICAVNGYAIGGGLELALACDFIIGSDKSEYGLPEAKVGSIPGAGGTQRLPRRIPYQEAMRMMLTAERIDAKRAYEIGLITEVVPHEKLMERAEELALKISENAPLSVRAIRNAVNKGLDMSLDKGLEYEKFIFGVMRDTKDRIEGRVAFQKKRKPNYRGQ